ncbi:MAG TPA: PilT/PilU family type 4a pilus ATPase [Sedimentisphaerales bacterium]|nr:PilT/PilU family type 4a pilus ATPase [Sedimentisphaerales bacterium]
MSPEQPLDAHQATDKEPQLNKYFKAAIKTMANDIHLKVGQPPKLRIYGELKNTTGEVLTAEQMEQLVFEIMSPAQKEAFLAQGTLDFAHEVGREHRFRLNVFRQRGMISLVGRRVSAHVPSFEKLNLPPILSKIAESRQGLVLVVGATGCGKTTTIAAMLDYITKTRSCHIVTIEDPIEYLYNDNKAIVSQREIGLDVPNFEDALTYLMRQDPDVVFVGEMRDAKTVTAGMRAAETGHMVMGTMHSSNASQAVHRLLDLFPTNERELVRQALATSIRAIVSQVLLPSIREGSDRIPAVEVLLATPAVRKLISEGREADLPAVIRASQREGMQDLTENLCKLVQDGWIDPKDAYKYAPNVEELKMALKGIRTTAEGIL